MGGYCYEDPPTAMDVTVLSTLSGHLEDSPSGAFRDRSWIDSALEPLRGDLSRDASLVCLTSAALRAIAEGMDYRRAGVPDESGLQPWSLIDSHFHPQHLRVRTALPRAMHEPGPGNAVPAEQVQRPWLSDDGLSMVQRDAASTRPGMPASIDLVLLREESREALWKQLEAVVEDRMPMQSGRRSSALRVPAATEAMVKAIKGAFRELSQRDFAGRVSGRQETG